MSVNFSTNLTNATLEHVWLWVCTPTKVALFPHWVCFTWQYFSFDLQILLCQTFLNKTCFLLVAVHLAAGSHPAVFLPLTSPLGTWFCEQIQSQVKCRAGLFFSSSCSLGSLCRLRAASLTGLSFRYSLHPERFFSVVVSLFPIIFAKLLIKM